MFLHFLYTLRKIYRDFKCFFKKYFSSVIIVSPVLRAPLMAILEVEPIAISFQYILKMFLNVKETFHIGVMLWKIEISIKS